MPQANTPEDTSRLIGEAITSGDFLDGKISRIRIFLDRREALKAVGLAE